MVWAYVLKYLQVFLVGGVVCLIAQLLINHTKMTSARILVIFMLVGGLLEMVGVFKYIVQFGGSGITVPITGFGAMLVRGAVSAVDEFGFYGILKGGMAAVAAGLSVAIVLGFLSALIFKARTKK